MTFTDVRELQRQLKAQGVQLMTEADETTTGPAYSPHSTPMETQSLSISTFKCGERKEDWSTKS